MPVEVLRVVSDLFDQNAYVVRAPGHPAAVVVDPGFDAPRLLAAVRRLGVTVDAVLLTHGHVDHIAGVGAVKAAFPAAPTLIGPLDAGMLTDAEQNLSGPFGVPLTAPPADRTVGEGDVLQLAGLTFDVLDVPGHSPGHVAYAVRGEHMVFSGDTVFAGGGMGRVDFPGGSFEQLVQSVRGKLWPLGDGAAVHPGHGPATTVGRERRMGVWLG